MSSEPGRLTHSHQPSSAETRQRPHAVEKDHIAGHTAPKASGSKGDGRDEEARAAAKNVRHPPVEGLEGGAGDEIRRGQPRRRVGGPKLGADDGVGCGGDGAVEAVQEHVGHDGQLDPDEAPWGFP